MPSQRHKLEVNVNDSKNTRMDIDSAIELLDVRKDELMHIGRYQKAAQTAIQLAKDLGRPIRILDLGCGEVYTMRTLYKSFICKKSEVVRQYIGVDIDGPMLDKTADKFAAVLRAVNGKLIQKDITVDPSLKVRDGYFDLIIWFEMIEHVKPEFIPSMFQELDRVLNCEGILLVSTPNATGSNAKLPKDHVFEWAYEDLCELMAQWFNIKHTRGVCINRSRIPEREWKLREPIIEKVYQAFGDNTPFSSAVLGALFPAKYCKNVIYTLTKICEEGEDG